MGYAVRQEIERTVAEMQYYKKTKIFGAKQIEKIVKRRTQFITELEKSKTLQAYLKYIEHEVLLERIYMKRIKKRNKIERSYIRKGIKRLFEKAAQTFPSNTDIAFAHLDYLLSVEDKESVVNLAMLLPKKHFGVQEIWVYCAKILRKMGEVETSRLLMLLGVKVIKNKEDMLTAFIEMEALSKERDSEEIIQVLKKELQEIESNGLNESELKSNTNTNINIDTNTITNGTKPETEIEEIETVKNDPDK